MYFLRSIFVFACCIGVTYAARAVRTDDVLTFPEGPGPNGPIWNLDYCFVDTDNSRDGVKCDENSLKKLVGCKDVPEKICAYNVKDESDIVNATQTYYIESCTSTCNTDAGYSEWPKTEFVKWDDWDCGFLVKYCVCDGTACAKVKVKSEEQTIKGGTIYKKHACDKNVCTSTDETFIECKQGYYLDLDSDDKCIKCPGDINLYNMDYSKVEPTTKGVGATSKKECYISAGAYYYDVDDVVDEKNKCDEKKCHKIEIPDVYYTGS